jgi:Skp family chaperone for outer membrane proteins
MKGIPHGRSWTILGLMLVLSFGVAANAGAADLKFGYIDSARIFREFKDAQEAQARFDRQVQAWQTEATEKEKLVKQLRDEVRDQSPVLSSVKRQEKEEALQKAISDYERFIQDVWGPHGRAAQQNDEATRTVVLAIRAVVEKVAESKGVNFVVDAASGFIIYADKTFDLTPDVLGELNSEATGGAR